MKEEITLRAAQNAKTHERMSAGKWRSLTREGENQAKPSGEQPHLCEYGVIGNTSAFQADFAGSSPVIHSIDTSREQKSSENHKKIITCSL